MLIIFIYTYIDTYIHIATTCLNIYLCQNVFSIYYTLPSISSIPSVTRSFVRSLRKGNSTTAG